MSQVQPFFPICPSATLRRRLGLTYVLLMIPIAGFQQADFSKTSRTVEIRTADSPDSVALLLYGRSWGKHVELSGKGMEKHVWRHFLFKVQLS